VKNYCKKSESLKHQNLKRLQNHLRVLMDIWTAWVYVNLYFFKFFRPKNSKNFIHYNIDATERMTKVANNRKNEAVPRVRDP
jgi:hypothetical protein